MELLKNFWKKEDGLGTVEIVVVIAILIGVALIFRKAIFEFVNGILDKVFDKGTRSIKEDTLKNRAIN